MKTISRSVLTGDTYDDCAVAAKRFTEENGMTFIPPFDDVRIIEGQATVAIEILADNPVIDYVFVPVGGGGLSAGVDLISKLFSPNTKDNWPGTGRSSIHV